MLHGADQAAPAREALDEIGERSARLARELLRLDDLAGGLEQGNSPGAGKGMEPLQRRVAEAALGHIDDALELEVVRRIGGDLEIGDGVLDLGALVEARAADDPIGQPRRHEPVLEGAHLEGGAHEDRDLVQGMSRRAEALDRLADPARLLLVVPDAGDRHFRAELAVGEERLAEPATIAGDEPRRRRENVARGPVVALEADDAGAGEVVLEAQDVVDLGPAPAVDRLVVVAHAADVGRALGEELEPEVLGDVGVLVLVDEDEAEAALVVGEHVVVLAKEPQAFEEEVAEVGGVELLQASLIGAVELGAPSLSEAEGLAGGDLVGGEAAVLPAVDQGRELARRPAVLVETVRLDHLLDEADLIVGVEDGEAGLQADELGMAAQDLDADGVERAEPGHGLDRPADEGGDAVLHLARGLVGEGDGEDLMALRTPCRQDVGDAGGEHARLAGAGPRQNQDRAVERHRRLALLLVEPVQIERSGGHGAGALRQGLPGLVAAGIGLGEIEGWQIAVLGTRIRPAVHGMFLIRGHPLQL